MCGPLAVAVACSCPARRTDARLAAFLGGKLGTYLVLGLAAGLVGSAFSVGRQGPRAFAALAIVAGGFMVWFGALVLWRRISTPAPRAPGPVSTLLSAALRSRSQLAPFFAGALAGLLPCGLVWAMVARSATAGPPLAATLVMGSFGLGTTPSLLATGWLSKVARGRVRRFGELAAASAVVVMGCLSVWRGASAMLMPAGCPFCHGA
jgi:hypothetical protein